MTRVTDYSAKKQPDGSYEVSVNELASAAYNLFVKLEGDLGLQNVQGSPHSVSVHVYRGPYAPKCSVVGSFSTPLVAGTSRQLTTTVIDYYGQPANGSGVEASLDGVLGRGYAGVGIKYSSSATKQSSPSNTWKGSVTAQISGKYNVSVFVRQADSSLGLVGSKTNALVVKPAAIDAAHCTMNVSGSVIVTAGNKTTLKITARDRFGNQQEAGGASFTLKVGGSSLSSETTSGSVDNNDGTYSVATTVTLADSYYMQVLYGGKEIKGSPARLIVQPVDKAHASTTTVERGIVESNAVSEYKQRSKFFVVPRDKYGNLLKFSNSLVELQVEQGSKKIVLERPCAYLLTQ